MLQDNIVDFLRKSKSLVNRDYKAILLQELLRLNLQDDGGGREDPVGFLHLTIIFFFGSEERVSFLSYGEKMKNTVKLKRVKSGWFMVMDGFGGSGLMVVKEGNDDGVEVGLM
ncbi:hypothetical protein GQ457_04G019300 [Hibiscus cannabinus]